MKHLLILRCGKKSIHKIWMNRIRNLMDIAFVYYDDSNFSDDNPTYTFLSKGTKLTGVYDFIIHNETIINKYDYFWLFEDDLILPYTTAEGIINFIEIYNPSLSAPSLSSDSYFTHPFTLQLPSLLLRGVDTVECMSPIMNKNFLYLTLEQLKKYPIWGIERYWQHLLWKLKEVAFIYDKWPILHTRPVGKGTLYQTAHNNSINYAQDDYDALQLYTLKFNTFMNILFGIEDKFNSNCLYGSFLRNFINFNLQLLEEIHGNNILNKVLEKTFFSNNLFSQFLSFNIVKKLLNINKGINGDLSNVIVKEWSFGNQTTSETWCGNMIFNFNGKEIGRAHV